MGVITTALGALIAFLGRKFSVATTTITGFVLLTAVLIACINNLVSAVLAMLQLPNWIAAGLGFFIPSNFGAVLAAIISSHICRAAYDLAMLKIKTINAAT